MSRRDKNGIAELPSSLTNDTLATASIRFDSVRNLNRRGERGQPQGI